MKRQDTNKTLVLAADSWGDLTDTAARRPSALGCWGDASQTRIGRSWTGTDTFNEAIDLARYGWKEGARRLLTGLESFGVPSTLPAMHPAWDWDVAGSVPDVGAYCAGVPEHMGTPGDVDPSAQPVTRLAVSCAAGWWTKAEQIERFAVALASHVQALQSAGYSVALTWTWSTDKNRDRVAVRAPLLAPGQPLDMAALAFAFHPAALRSLAFAVAEQEPDFSVLGGGYGRPRDADPDELEPGTIILPSPKTCDAADALNSIEAAAEYIGRAIADAQPTYAEAA